MEPGETRSSVGICLPFLVLVSSLDQEPLRCRFLLPEWDPALLERDSRLRLSCITCKALSLFASQSRSNGSDVLGIGDLYLCVSHHRHLKSSQHHIPSIAIRVIYVPPQARGCRGKVRHPDLNFASVIKAHGSNWGFAGRGTRKTGASAGTWNMSSIGLSS